MSEERISLDNIRTPEAWEVLKKLIGEQRENTTMPFDIREVFFTDDVDRLSEMSLSGNAVIAAVARASAAGVMIGGSGGGGGGGGGCGGGGGGGITNSQ